MPAVARQHVLEAQAFARTRLRRPAGRLAGEDLGDVDRLGQHRRGCHQHGEHDLGGDRLHQPHAPAIGGAARRIGQRPGRRHQLGRVEEREGEREDAGRRSAQHRRPGRQDLACETGQDHAQPHRRGDVGRRAEHELEPAHPVEAAAGEQRDVLDVALRPAPVADGMVDHGRRELLVAPLDHHHVHGPAAAAEQRRLDHVVAHDMAAEGAAPLQLRKPAALREGAGAQDRIMAPEARLSTRPPEQARRRDGAVEPARELLPALEDARRADHRRHRLQEPDARMRVHDRGEQRDRPPAHQAVGVEHQHIFIGPAEAAYPFGDVAGLARDVLVAPAVIDRQRRGRGQPLPGGPLDRAGLGMAVGEDEDIDRLRPARIRHGARHRLDAREDLVDRLVVDRHEDGGAAVRRVRDVRRQDIAGELARHQQREAHRRAGEAEGDPAEQQGEQQQEQRIPDRGAALAAIGEDHRELVGDADHHRQREDDDERAARAHVVRGGADLARRRLGAAEALLGHGERRFRRKRGHARAVIRSGQAPSR